VTGGSQGLDRVAAYVAGATGDEDDAHGLPIEEYLKPSALTCFGS
jgi:hypothetical protein